VEDEEIDAPAAPLESPELPLVTRFVEHAHEVSSAMEGDAALLPSGLDAEGDSEVSLAGADRSRKKHVVAALDPPAASKLGERAGLDVVGGGEVELVERLVLGEARRFEPRANRR